MHTKSKMRHQYLHKADYMTKLKKLLNTLLYLDTSTSSQVSNCDGVVLEIYLHHKSQ